jgi:hypothetical protein
MEETKPPGGGCPRRLDSVRLSPETAYGSSSVSLKFGLFCRSVSEML